MHCGINRQEHRARLKPLQDLMHRPLVFCDKSMWRPPAGQPWPGWRGQAPLRRRQDLSAGRPPGSAAKKQRKSGVFSYQTPTICGIINLHRAAAAAKSRDRILPRAFVTSPNPFDGPIITHVRTCSNMPMRSPPGVLAQLLLFCQLLHALVHASRGPAGRDAGSGSIEPIVRRSS